MLNVTDKCFISPAAVKGLPDIREIICVFLRHKGEAPSLSAHCNKKFRTEFTLLSFILLSGMAGLPSPLFGSNHLVKPDFPSFIICLN